MKETVSGSSKFFASSTASLMATPGVTSGSSRYDELSQRAAEHGHGRAGDALRPPAVGMAADYLVELQAVLRREGDEALNIGELGLAGLVGDGPLLLSEGGEMLRLEIFLHQRFRLQARGRLSVNEHTRSRVWALVSSSLVEGHAGDVDVDDGGAHAGHGLHRGGDGVLHCLATPTTLEP